MFRLCMTYTLVLTGLFGLVTVIWRNPFASVFTADSMVIEYASIRMMIVMSTKFLTTVYEIPGSAMQGMGHSFTPAILTVFGTCIFRLLWVWTVCRIFPAFEVLLLVYPVSWVITGTAVLAAYYAVRKKVLRPEI